LTEVAVKFVTRVAVMTGVAASAEEAGHAAQKVRSPTHKAT
jgi:hypothetical protein